VVAVNRIADCWYVSFRNPTLPLAVYVKTNTFKTELKARQFAAARLAEGCDVMAGTLDPCTPKRSIGLSKIPDWLGTLEPIVVRHNLD
jgi:hypothetical protein